MVPGPIPRLWTNSIAQNNYAPGLEIMKQMVAPVSPPRRDGFIQRDTIAFVQLA